MIEQRMSMVPVSVIPRWHLAAPRKRVTPAGRVAGRTRSAPTTGSTFAPLAAARAAAPPARGAAVVSAPMKATSDLMVVSGGGDITQVGKSARRTHRPYLCGSRNNARVAQSRMRELEDFTVDQRAHISRLQKPLVAEKESCTGAQSALEMAQKEAACHKASLAGIRKFCDALQRDVAAKEDERAAAQSAVERGREQLHKLTADATAEQQRLREQVDSAKAAAAAQEKEAAEAGRQLQLVTATLGDVQQRADALGAECVSLKAQQKAGDEAQRQLQADLDRRIGLGNRLASDLSILRERAQAARLDEKERRASLEEDVGRLQGLVERHTADSAAAEALAAEALAAEVRGGGEITVHGKDAAEKMAMRFFRNVALAHTFTTAVSTESNIL